MPFIYRKCVFTVLVAVFSFLGGDIFVAVFS